MATNNWKWMGVVLGGLLVVGGASLGNACGSDSTNATGTGVITPDGGSAGSTTDMGSGGGTTTDTGGAGGAGGSAGAGTGGTAGTGGAGGAGTGGAGGSAGTSTCQASGSFDNATRLKDLLGPDGGLPPL